ncbi:MAG: M3 family oligoendopeptidase, partial [Chloroflexia bacterium]|nr:M3 family oligoendopeptidase [Chloroflexia bacterium]
MGTTPAALPRWDMSVIYPSLDSPEFAEGFAALGDSVNALERLFGEWHVERRAISTVEANAITAFETITAQLNETLTAFQTMGAYLTGFVAVDSRDNAAQARQSELRQLGAKLSILETRYTAWVGSLDAETLIAQSELAEAHAFTVRQLRVAAQHLLSLKEEELVAALHLSSGAAWSKLHGDVTSQVAVTIDRNGQPETLPMSAIRNLATDQDRDVRRSAYEAELEAWESHAVPLAAALNSIKGEGNTLAFRRGWESPLAEALFTNHIDQRTLDVMLASARDAFPDLRRYLHLKAQALGVKRLAWYDLFAPVGQATTTWDFENAVGFLSEQFGTFSAKMRDLSDRAFKERWVDAGPRSGKRDGAFCMLLRGDESRILANFTPAYDGVSTLAHELGHAYHNLNEAGLTPLQQMTPMTLAETASTFCETIVRHAAFERADPGEQLLILEAALQDASQIVLDITSRFLFESRVFAKRLERELSVQEFNEIMLESQRETYGDGLDGDLLHPYMWAVKGHYYNTGRSFYNFPYMFGLLFGMGLYARYQNDPTPFAASYDALLSSTGLADAAELA